MAGELALVSITGDDVKGNIVSDLPSLSADGTRVAFLSNSTNLDPMDTDSFVDIYVKNMNTGELVLASTSQCGKANDSSTFLSLSANGFHVAFESAASNLHPAGTSDGPFLGKTVRIRNS